jgi:signal transduction histidine kinase/CheY-like chemotaxis protein
VQEPQAEVLGRLLVIQELLEVMPDDAGIASFLRQALRDVPGISDVYLCVRGVLYPPNEFLKDACVRFAAARDTPTSIGPEDFRDLPGTVLMSLASTRHLYGFLAFSIDSLTAFSAYESFLRNTANLVATVLEKRDHIDELARANDTLTRANALLESVNKELETFLYSVSHVLRAPLRAIDGFSHILLEDYAGKLDEEGKRLLRVVRENAVHMGQLIDDILAVSRAGRTEVVRAKIDMEALTRAVIEEMAPAVAGRKVEFKVGALPPAYGDPTMIQRVLENLIDNAIKYTGPKPEAHIEIGATAGEKENVYFVRDNGVGFDMKYIDKLFGVFTRLHGSEFPGNGIGLAIVNRIISRHGGSVRGEGKVNEGATFYFSLPARGSVMPDVASVVDVQSAEDNPKDAKICFRALKKRSLANRPLWVKDGAEALDERLPAAGAANRLGNSRSKVVLLDLRLPKIDGIDVLRRLQSDARTKTIPVVVPPPPRRIAMSRKATSWAPTAISPSRWRSTNSLRSSDSSGFTGWSSTDRRSDYPALEEQAHDST